MLSGWQLYSVVYRGELVVEERLLVRTLCFPGCETNRITGLPNDGLTHGTCLMTVWSVVKLDKSCLILGEKNMHKP